MRSSQFRFVSEKMMTFEPDIQEKRKKKRKRVTDLFIGIGIIEIEGITNKEGKEKEKKNRKPKYICFRKHTCFANLFEGVEDESVLLVIPRDKMKALLNVFVGQELEGTNTDLWCIWGWFMVEVFIILFIFFGEDFRFFFFFFWDWIKKMMVCMNE